MLIVINFKNYRKGKKVLKLAKKIEKYLPKAIVCIPSVNIKEISEKTKLKVFAQHVEKNSDRETGFLTVDAAKKSGANGSLLNHSEHKIGIKKIREIGREKIKLIVCASNLNEVGEIKKIKPYAIAFEDPKLISTRKSITKYNPEAIRKFIKILKGTSIIPLCGAGINSKSDILEAKKLGCKGVLISSAIANSKNPDKILGEISEI